MPFWMAALFSRLLFLLIPILGVLYPLLRFMPATYGWMMRRKIARVYGELRFIEDELATKGKDADINAMTERLDRIEDQAHHLRMPVAYEGMLYLLRDHIAVVRTRLKERQPRAA
jgi:hypothetical protein